MRIIDLPESERPREKLVYRGPEVLNLAEILALIIRTGTGGKSAFELAEEVLSYAELQPGGLFAVDVKELVTIDGMGVSKAASVVAAVEFARRLNTRTVSEKKSVTCPDDAVNLLMDSFRFKKKEYLVALLLDSKCRVESEHVISIGELSSTIIHPREVFSPAVKRSAAAVVLAHNHPSGDPTPSENDIEATRRLEEAGKILGIRLLDHIIIGDGIYISLRREGYFLD